MSGVFFGAGVSKGTDPLPAWTSWVIGAQGDVPNSSNLPVGCQIYTVSLEIGGLGPATTVTGYLAYDAAGTQPISPHATGEATQAISAAGGGGFVIWRLDVPLVNRGGPYFFARPDAGALTGARPFVTARNVE